MNREKYLPVGSIVLLKDAKVKIMIMGFLSQSKKIGDIVFDYVGCIYPIGVYNSDESILFNHDQIEKIFNIGYENEEWKEFEPFLKTINKSDVEPLKTAIKEKTDENLEYVTF